MAITEVPESESSEEPPEPTPLQLEIKSLREQSDKLNVKIIGLEAERVALREEQSELIATRNVILRRMQLLTRYGGKIKPEDLEDLQKLQAADKSTKLKPGVAEVATRVRGAKA